MCMWYTNAMNTRHHASGCLFGLALGDALGADTEFLSVEAIKQRWGPQGPPEPLGDPARVTDDTQMALAVGEALAETVPPYTARTVEAPLRRAFVAWMVSPDNTRAPGMTCMQACGNLLRGAPWHEATVAGSKGCGANMRVAPVGLLPGVGPDGRAALAQFQAALTHGHPTGLAASDLTAYAVADLAADGPPATLPARLRDYARSQRLVYHDDWLGPLWQRPGARSAADFIARGWDECLEVLDRLDAALSAGDREADPCAATGGGWVAEEALATGLLCFLLFPDDPVAAVRRAAVTSGDSDSIASLAGAFAGARHGLAAWPRDWVRRIEYRDRIAALGDGWDSCRSDVSVRDGLTP
uniref:ADP-ribosylglycohydrolase n=1 Tax=uncultured Armatimonadetes bacterium TaxID=157466 RepID=A0A6J4JZZ5_9BACT|nr:ADP-ribosylglycohydrolase [uncultured Armatimonadetes bacterium]